MIGTAVDRSHRNVTPRIGWILSHDRATASSRLQGHLIHDWLRSHGHRSSLIAENFNRVASIYAPAFLKVAMRLRRSACSVVVFEGPEWPMHQLARMWRLWGGRAVGVRCDPLPGPFDETFDLTIVPTATLRDALHIARAVVIDDCVDVSPGLFKRDHRQSPRLRVVWVGHHGYQSYITGLVARLQANPDIHAGFEFELISRGAFATRQWSEATIAADILAADIALIAIPSGSRYVSKSTNRLAMMMSLGMPIVATLIPSYQELARDGENGLFVTTDAQIGDCLRRLRDRTMRAKLGQSARASVAGRYGLDVIGPRWLATLERVATEEPLPPPSNTRLSLLARAVGALSPM
jgi:glycosyltransferase involved in cell wall biosynthesis